VCEISFLLYFSWTTEQDFEEEKDIERQI